MLKINIIKSGIWSYLNVFFRGTIAILVGLLFSRFIDVEIYGYFVIGSIIIMFLTYCGGLGVSEFIIHKEKIDAKEFKNCLSITFVASLFLILVLNTFLLVIPLQEEYSKIIYILKILSIVILPRNLLGVINSKWYRELNNKVITKISIVVEIFSFFIALFLVFKIEPLNSLLIYTIAKSILHLLITLKIKEIKLQFSFDYKLAKEIIKFGFPLIISSVINYINLQAPKIACALFLGPYYLGLLSAAILITDSLHGIFQTSLWSLWMPFLGKTKREFPKRFGEMYLRVRNMQSSIIIPILISIIALREELVELFLPNKFYQISNLMPLLCVSGIIISCNYLFKPVLILVGETKKRLYYDFSRLILYLIFFNQKIEYSLDYILYSYLIIEFILFIVCQVYLQSIIKKRLIPQLSTLKSIFISSLPLIIYPLIFGRFLEEINNISYLFIFISSNFFSYLTLIYITDKKLFLEFFNFKNILKL